MPMKTMAEIAAENLAERGVLIDMALAVSPELMRVPTRTINGINYRVRTNTANPTAAFREANEGTDFSFSTGGVETIECDIVTCQYAVDAAVARASEDGPEVELAREGRRQLSAVYSLVGQQFYYGSDVDAKGHPGLNGGLVTEMIIDAGLGTEPSDSVWAVKYGEDGVQWVIGRNGEIEVSDPWLDMITGSNDKPLMAYIQVVQSHVGLQQVNPDSIAAIKGLNSDNPLTDDLLADLVGLFPVALGGRPDAIFMSRPSRTQLQKSRTATTASGAAVPLPTEYDGIELIITDNIPLSV